MYSAGRCWAMKVPPPLSLLALLVSDRPVSFPMVRGVRRCLAVRAGLEVERSETTDARLCRTTDARLCRMSAEARFLMDVRAVQTAGSAR